MISHLILNGTPWNLPPHKKQNKERTKTEIFLSTILFVFFVVFCPGLGLVFCCFCVFCCFLLFFVLVWALANHEKKRSSERKGQLS